MELKTKETQKEQSNIHNVTKNIKLKLKFKQKRFIFEYLRQLGHISRTCKQIKINRKTFYDWMKDDLFNTAFNEAEESFNDDVELKLLIEAKTGDKDLMKFWAKNKMKHRGFIDKSEIEHTGNNNILTINLVEKSVEEIKDGKPNNKHKTEGNI